MIDPDRARLAGWDARFLYLAQYFSAWSKDPSTKVGCVIVRPDFSIASMGFNGFPRGMADLPERLEDREQKYSRTIHAEINAILTAREPLHGYTLYNWPLGPCDHCAIQIIQAGIKRVVAPATDNPRWKDSLDRAETYLKECGVVVDWFFGIKDFSQG